jgi:thiazolinyl imide reductase
MKDKLKVLVCGTTFGQFYIEALRLLKEDFEIAGIFAHGSERSKMCSKNYNLPLYTDFEELPKDIDLACIVIRSRAIGGKGTDLAVKFLERGVNVIQEQPIHPKDLEICYRTAKKNNTYFQTGDLYTNLTEVQRFIECAKYLNQIKKPVYINASFCPQVSYPAIDILSKALPSIRLWEINEVVKDFGVFQIFTGKLGGIPITIEYHNQIDPNDPDNYMHLLHSISFIYENGRLALEDTFGPTIWHPRMHVPVELYNRANINGEYPEYLNDNSAKILGNYTENSYKDIITKQWPIAISKDLLSIKDLILQKKNSNQKAQQEILCSNQWSKMTKILGYAEFINGDGHNYVDSNVLSKIAANI